MGIFWQAIGTTVACYLSTSMGLMFAWPSSTIRLFSSNNTTLNRPMDESEIALFGSLSSVGAIVSTPLAGYFLDIWGRKNCALISSLTHVIAWSIILISNRVEAVLTAVFISGIGGAVFLVVPLYVGEFCQENIRGAMTGGSMIFYGIGLLLSYLFGGCLEYNIMIYVSLTMAIFGVFMLVPMKESPMFLLKIGRDEEAQKTLAFYRGASIESKEVLEEMATMRRALNPDMDEDTPEEEKLQPKLAVEKTKFSLWQFLKKSYSTRRWFLVTGVLISASIFQGLVVVQVYAEPLFAEAVPTISPTICSVMFAILTVVVGFLAAYLTDIAGRRPLIIYSSLVSTLLCGMLGAQLQVHWAPHWVTAILIYGFCTTYTFGAGTVPYILPAEVFLPEVKSIMSMIVVEWAWVTNFLILLIFNPLVNVIGLGNVFYVFGIICFLTSVFSFFCLPETKGLAVDQIQMLFTRKKDQNRA